MPFARAALELLTPGGIARWIGLLAAEPDLVAGTYTEISDSEYERISHSAWVNDDITGGIVTRANNGAIVFNAVVDADITTITHWGIFDAAVAGNLLVCGPMRNLVGEVEPLDVPTNEQIRFDDRELVLLSEELP